MRFLYTLAVFLTVSTIAIAGDDSLYRPINMLQKKNSFMQNIPVYDQGAGNTCYSYAASNLIDYYRISHGEKIYSEAELSSPLWLANIFSAHSKSFSKISKWFKYSNFSVLAHGVPSWAIKLANRYGICTVRQTNLAMSAFTNKLRDKTGIEIEATNFLQILGSLLFEIKREQSMFLLGKELPKYETLLPFNLKFTAPRPIFKAINPVESISESESARQKDANSTPILKTSRQLVPIDLMTIIPNQVDQTYFAPKGSTLVSQNAVALKMVFQNIIKNYISYFEKTKNKDGKIFFGEYIHWLWSFNKNPELLESQINDLLKTCTKTNQIVTKIPTPESRLLVGTKIDMIKSTINSLFMAKNPQPIAIIYCSEILYPEENGDEKSTDVIPSPSHITCDYHSSILLGQRILNKKLQYLVQNSWGTSCSGYNEAWECVPDQGALWVDADILLDYSLQISWLPNSTP